MLDLSPPVLRVLREVRTNPFVPFIDRSDDWCGFHEIRSCTNDCKNLHCVPLRARYFFENEFGCVLRVGRLSRPVQPKCNRQATNGQRCVFALTRSDLWASAPLGILHALGSWLGCFLDSKIETIMFTMVCNVIRLPLSGTSGRFLRTSAIFVRTSSTLSMSVRRPCPAR